MDNKVSAEVAKLEIEKWLDHKKVSERKRESNKESIELLQDAIADGCLALNEVDFTLTQFLKVPIVSEKNTEKLIYAPRITVGKVYNHLQGLKPTDADGRLHAYAAALTSNPKELIKNLDLADYDIVTAIVVFFL